MTDSEAVKLARRVDRLRQEAVDLMQRFCDEHANGGSAWESLYENELLRLPTLATHCIHHHLSRPERWQITCRGIERAALGAAGEKENASDG